MKNSWASYLPKTVDETGANWGQPGRVPFIVTCIVCAAAVLVGLVLAFTAGLPLRAFGLALALGGVLAFALFWFGSCFLVRALLERKHSHDVDEDGPYISGPMLGKNMDKFPHTAFVLASTRQEIAAMDYARREELAKFEQWHAGAPRLVKVQLTSYDGLRLTGHVLMANQESGKWVICVHGYHGIWTEHMMHVRRYAQAGYNLLFPELRCQGLSEGRYVGLGWLDRRDLVSWARFLVDEYGRDVRIVLHGHSMGAAAACLTAAERDLPDQVKAVISDCAYSDIWSVALGIAKDGIHVPAHPLLDFMRVRLATAHGGYDVRDAAPLVAIGRVKLPTLFVHGKKDSFVPPYMSRLLFDACGSDDKRLVMVEGAGHCLSCLADPGLYYGELFGFLGEHVDGT